MNRLVSLYCHWGARLGATAAVFLVIVFLIGQGVPDLGALERTEGVLLAWFFLALVGLAMIWRWETTGAVISLAAMAGFFATELLANGALPGGWVLWAFFAPGLLALVSVAASARRQVS